jgi:uncharacterized protein (TIGR02246 family)
LRRLFLTSFSIDGNRLMLHRLLALAALLAASLPARPALAQSNDAAADSAAIHAASRAFSAAYVRGDAEAMAAAYTADGVIFPERAEMITGREAIRRYWTWAPGNRVTHHLATPAQIRVEGDVAYDYGVFEIAGERGGEPWGPRHGKYVIVWRREADGAWRMQLDIWNSRPEPGR